MSRLRPGGVTELEAMTRTHARYHLAFRLKGVRKLFTYGVDQAEHDRFAHRFSEEPGPAAKPFFIFTSGEGFEVIVRVRHVVHAHALWDAAIVEQQEEIDAERRKSRSFVRIYIAGSGKPYTFRPAASTEVMAVYARLDDPGARAAEFVQWRDEDGELMVINVGHLMLLEIPAGMVIAPHAEPAHDAPPRRPRGGRQPDEA